MLPHEILAADGNYADAYRSLSKQCGAQEKIIRELLTQNVTKAIADYDSHVQKSKDETIRKDKLINTLTVLIGVIIISALTYIIISISRARKRNEEQIMLQAESLTEELKRRDLLAERSGTAIRELFGKRFESIEMLCGTYYECLDTPRNQKKIYEDVKSIISGLSSDSKMLSNLEQYADKYMSNLMSDFRSMMPELKESDYQLFLYCVLGFSARSISLFIDEKVEVVYNRKSRLKAKIKQPKNYRRDEFLTYL